MWTNMRSSWINTSKWDLWVTTGRQQLNLLRTLPTVVQRAPNHFTRSRARLSSSPVATGVFFPRNNSTSPNHLHTPSARSPVRRFFCIFSFKVLCRHMPRLLFIFNLFPLLPTSCYFFIQQIPCHGGELNRPECAEQRNGTWRNKSL